MDKVTDYFKGDIMSAEVWKDKYCIKDKQGNPVEETPTDTHKRLAKEFARIEFDYKSLEENTLSNKIEQLSKFGKILFIKRLSQSQEEIEQEFFNYFDKFGQIVPQGSIMSNLGNYFVFGSLSNCFGIAPPSDSYAGIMRADQELVQLMKRRGGVGTHLNNLRPNNAHVSNSAKSSSGATSFAERYSNSTREVAQEGRRGALMLLLSVQHPDIFKFVKMKEDKTKVTGANVSVMFTDDFMMAVEVDDDYMCRFPIEQKLTQQEIKFIFSDSEYNKMYSLTEGRDYCMKIKAKELFDEFVNMAHSNAEPGAAYIDRIQDYAPDGVYELYKPILCNPCGEQWFSADETCRLIALNLFSIVKNPFTTSSEIDFDLLYEISYMQQRLGDNLVDLEVEYIIRILDKLGKDLTNQPNSIYEEARCEQQLWYRILAKAQEGRRTGGGFTGLADMLAALNIKYSESDSIIDTVMSIKMRAELDATIDMAILRGTFTGWNKDLEYKLRERFLFSDNPKTFIYEVDGENEFFRMLMLSFPEQATRMYKYGRRNVSWSTVAPTGTVSLMTQTTSGLEPLFKAFYIRRKKVNPSNPNVRVDFTDPNGDNWQEYPILHPKFRDWIFSRGSEVWKSLNDFDNIISDKDKVEELFKQSPWFGSEASNIDWQSRIRINAIIQKYTSNALSCTINLPEDIDKETVSNIYFEGWKAGLKGITVYREGSRTGVLISNTIVKVDEFGYTDAIKRPEILEADYHCILYKGRRHGVIIGLLNNKPYELFAFEDCIKDDNVKGKLIKVKSGVYKFISNDSNYKIDNVQLTTYSDEKLLTRWVSLLLRHGANPKFIADQVDKSELMVNSFVKAIVRVLKTYIPDEAIGEACPNCGEHTMIYEEGCKKCTSCGSSKC